MEKKVMKKSSVKLFVENCKNSSTKSQEKSTAPAAVVDPQEILAAMPPQARRLMEKSIARGERPAWSALAVCVLENTPKKSMPLGALYAAVGAGIGEAVYACKNDRAAIRGSLYQAKNILHENGIISLVEAPVAAKKAPVAAKKAPVAAKKAAPAPAPAAAPACALSTEDLLRILSCRLGK